MTDPDRPGDATTAAGTEHGGGHDGHGDQRGAEETVLGPIDWPSWRAAAIGVAVAAVVVLVLYLAVYGRGAPGG